MAKTVKRYRSGRRGFVLSLVVCIAVILLLMGPSMLQMGFLSRLRAIRMSEDIAARTAADAGLERALYLMNDALEAEVVWSGYSLPTIAETDLANCSANYSVAVSGDSGIGYSLVSTGNSGKATRNVYSDLRLKGLYEFAVLVKEDISLFPNSSVDGYNSETGETDIPAIIGTNSTGDGSVIVMNNASVDGDVIVGVGGDPGDVIINRGDITGASYGMGKEQLFAPIEPPLLPDMGTSIDVATGMLLMSPADNGKYTGIDMKTDAIIRIEGGDMVMHITGDIDLGGAKCEIQIAPGSSLTLYLDGDMFSGNSSGINNENSSPSTFTLYGTGDPVQNIELKAKNEFYGTVYAPDASVSIKAGGDIYGSFVATDFEMKSDSALHYDAALSEVDIDDIGVRFVSGKWRED